MFRCPQCPHMFKHPHISQMLPCASACSGGVCMSLGDVGALLLFRQPPIFWMLPQVSNTPHAFLCSPACLYVLGVIACAMGVTSHILEAGELQDICQAFGVCQYIHWMSIMLHLVPFLYFIMSQVSTSTTTTTTPPVTVVSSGMSSLSLVTIAPSLMGFPAMLGQLDEVLLPPLTPRGSAGVLGHVSVPQHQTPPSMPLQACANYAMGSPQVGFVV